MRGRRPALVSVLTQLDQVVPQPLKLLELPRVCALVQRHLVLLGALQELLQVRLNCVDHVRILSGRTEAFRRPWAGLCCVQLSTTSTGPESASLRRSAAAACAAHAHPASSTAPRRREHRTDDRPHRRRRGHRPTHALLGVAQPVSRCRPPSLAAANATVRHGGPARTALPNDRTESRGHAGPRGKPERIITVAVGEWRPDEYLPGVFGATGGPLEGERCAVDLRALPAHRTDRERHRRSHRPANSQPGSTSSLRNGHSVLTVGRRASLSGPLHSHLASCLPREEVLAPASATNRRFGRVRAVAVDRRLSEGRSGAVRATVADGPLTRLLWADGSSSPADCLRWSRFAVSVESR